MNTPPTKLEVLAALNINQARLCEILGLTAGAISQWPDDKPIPMLRWLQLKHELFPEVFAGQGRAAQQREAA